MKQVIVTKGKQTIEACHVAEASGIVLAYKNDKVVGFVTSFDGIWCFRNTMAHKKAHEYATLEDLIQDYKEYQFYLQ